MNWRIVLVAGVVVAALLVSCGFFLDRNEVGVREPQGVYYVHQWPSPFEREVFLEPDHRAMLSEGDSALWYFGGGLVMALTLASIPLLMERERNRGRRAAEPPG